AEPGLTTIFQSWFISLLGPNVTAWRLSSVFAVWLAALPLYFLVRATLGKRTAWITLALYAVSPYVLTYARMGYDTAQTILPVVLALALTWLAVRRDSRFYAFLAGGAAGLSFFTPASARIAIVLVPVWLVWTWITRQSSGGTIGRQLAAGVLGVVVIAAPPIVYSASHASEAYLGKQFESSFNNVFYARDFYPESQLFDWYNAIPAGQQQLFYAPQLYLPLIGRGVVRTALAFHLPSIVHENYLVGSLADPLGVLYLIGLAWSLVRWRRSSYAIWPAWLLLGGFMAGALSAYPPRAALLFPIAPALVTLGALGLTAGIDVLATLIGHVPERIKSAGLIVATALLALLGLRAYFVEMPQRFPPDLDNAVFWEAQALGPKADITLIQPADVPDNYAPWGVQQFDLSEHYHLIKKADLPATDWNGLCPSGECRFVYVSADRDSVYPYLAQAYGERTPAEIRGADGAVQAYVYVR
ncbi:MAG TPA: glycosyltransferase family 39 protein, partial [Anaerolineae bacterium]|nr:glycosyltransferase family 39 protein [Anaerolineae bacterium]